MGRTGMPAGLASPATTLARGNVGKGQAYYIGTRTDGDFLADFYGALSRKLGLRRDLDGQWPEGVSVRKRCEGFIPAGVSAPSSSHVIKISMGC